MQTHQSLTNKCLQNSGAEHDVLDGHNRRLRYVIGLIRSNHNEVNWGYIKITSVDMDDLMHKQLICISRPYAMYEGWNYNSGNYLFTTDTK